MLPVRASGVLCGSEAGRSAPERAICTRRRCPPCQHEFVTVSERERYLFGTRGYLVLRGVLSPDQVATFKGHLDRLAPEQISDSDERDRALRWLFDVHRDFASLMDHETVLPYLRAFVDDKVRIDGAYALVKLPSEGVSFTPVRRVPETAPAGITSITAKSPAVSPVSSGR